MPTTPCGSPPATRPPRWTSTALPSRFGCRVEDGFGSTEGGVYVVRTPDTPAGSIGVAPPGVDILDLATDEPVPPARFDEQGRLLNPDEAIGELVNTGGSGAFEGYYDSDSANAERMRGGMYHSGDLAYRSEQGFVYFAGRTIDWLRVDGENFGAAPVERILARNPAVSQVAVYAVPDVDTGDQVMAALKLHDGRSFDAAEFAAFLDAQSDLGTKWAPRYVRIAARPAIHPDQQGAQAGARAGGMGVRRPGVGPARPQPRIPAAHR